MITKKAGTIETGNDSKNENGGSKLKGKGKQILDKLFNRTELDKKIKLVKVRVENTVQLGFEKAVAHYENPSMYPLPNNSKSVEKAFYSFIQTLPNSKRNKMVDKINETLKASSAYRANKYKDLVNVNFKSSVSITDQVKAMPVPDELKFTEEEGNEMASEFKRKTENHKNTGYATSSKPQPQQAASASKVSFFVDNMTCLNPDDVRKDEINLAGFSVDSVGGNVEFGPLFVGKFRKNETVLLGGKSKLFTLNIDPAQLAQSFIAGLFIVESDLISNPDTIDKLTGVFLAIGLAITLVTGVLIVISVVTAPIITPFIATVFITIAATFYVIGLQIIPLMGDDISLAVTDTLAIADKVDVGETFARNLQIGKGFDPQSTFDGKYTAAARWVGEA